MKLPALFKRKPKSQIRTAGNLLLQLLKLRVVQIIVGLAIFLALAPLILFFIFRPTIQEDIEYGTTFSNKYATELGLDWRDVYIKILDDLGADNLRLVAYWDEIEPRKDQYDFSNIKWQLDEAEKRNVDVILAMGRKAPRWPECFEPDWWYEIDSRESRQLELYEYIKATTEELKEYESIKFWQVENEPFFPFGHCQGDIRKDEVEREISIVREIDSRPIIVQDSGEGGFWFVSYSMGDYLSISMYRKIWYDFWGILFGRFVYFQYPLQSWSYKMRAVMFGVPYDKVLVTELQAEPWGPGLNSELSDEEKNKSMSREDFIATISYAQKAGFKHLYLWGAEWWLWEKEKNNNPYFWDTAKALFN